LHFPSRSPPGAVAWVSSFFVSRQKKQLAGVRAEQGHHERPSPGFWADRSTPCVTTVSPLGNLCPVSAMPSLPRAPLALALSVSRASPAALPLQSLRDDPHSPAPEQACPGAHVAVHHRQHNSIAGLQTHGCPPLARPHRLRALGHRWGSVQRAPPRTRARPSSPKTEPLSVVSPSGPITSLRSTERRFNLPLP
jgi:hypothetical protein